MGSVSSFEQDGENPKVRCITSFFKEKQRQFEFLNKLFEQGHTQEALILCCCYIEGLGNLLYREGNKNKFHFVKILTEYGGDSTLFPMLHPAYLKRDILASKELDKVTKDIIIKKLETLETKLYTEEEILSLLSEIPPRFQDIIKRNVAWRSTMAAFVYSEMRSTHIHRLIGPNYPDYSSDGTPVPQFQDLYSALMNIHKRMTDISISEAKWFGHDDVL